MPAGQIKRAKKMTNTKAFYEKAAKICAKYVKIETGVGKCNGDKELADLVKKINHRKEVKNQPEISVGNFCKKLIEKRLNYVANALPNQGYSMESLYIAKLVSGKTKRELISYIDDRTSEYAYSSSYKAQHGRVSVSFTISELVNIHIIGGLITYFAAGEKSNIKKCWWYEGKGNKQFFKLEKVNGFIYANFHAKTKEAAKIGGIKNLLREKENKLKHEKYTKALKYIYSFADSLAAGNCEPGTRAFCLRFNLNIDKKYRGNYLLELVKGKSTSSIHYIENMIKYKATKK